MEHFHSDWTFKPITMLHVNVPIVSHVFILRGQSQLTCEHRVAIDKMMKTIRVFDLTQCCTD